MHTIQTVVDYANVKVGDIYERAAFPTDKLFRVFVREWRCQKGTIQDPGTHKGVEVVKVIARRAFDV